MSKMPETEIFQFSMNYHNYTSEWKTIFDGKTFVEHQKKKKKKKNRGQFGYLQFKWNYWFMF